jgi:hypothetical protein
MARQPAIAGAGQLSAAHWRKIAAAIGPDIANRTKLPSGHSLREGFCLAIWNEIRRAAEPTPAEVRNDLRRFVASIGKAHMRMSPQARALWRDPVDGWPDFPPDMKEAMNRMAASLREDAAESTKDMFLTDIVWLVSQCEGVAVTLPGNAYLNTGEDYVLFRAARAAVAVALALARRHEQAAVPALYHILHGRKARTFVEHLRHARNQVSLLWAHLRLE